MRVVVEPACNAYDASPASAVSMRNPADLPVGEMLKTNRSSPPLESTDATALPYAVLILSAISATVSFAAIATGTALLVPAAKAASFQLPTRIDSVPDVAVAAVPVGTPAEVALKGFNIVASSNPYFDRSVPNGELILNPAASPVFFEVTTKRSVAPSFKTVAVTPSVRPAYFALILLAMSAILSPAAMSTGTVVPDGCLLHPDHLGATEVSGHAQRARRGPLRGTQNDSLSGPDQGQGVGRAVACIPDRRFGGRHHQYWAVPGVDGARFQARHPF